MTKKIKVQVTVILEIEVKVRNTPETSEIMQEIDYDFTSTTEGAKVVNTEIQDFEQI